MVDGGRSEEVSLNRFRKNEPFLQTKKKREGLKRSER